MCIKLYSRRLWWAKKVIQFIGLRTFKLYYIGSNKIRTLYRYYTIAYSTYIDYGYCQILQDYFWLLYLCTK